MIIFYETILSNNSKMEWNLKRLTNTKRDHKTNKRFFIDFLETLCLLQTNMFCSSYNYLNIWKLYANIFLINVFVSRSQIIMNFIPEIKFKYMKALYFLTESGVNFIKVQWAAFARAKHFQNILRLTWLWGCSYMMSRSQRDGGQWLCDDITKVLAIKCMSDDGGRGYQKLSFFWRLLFNIFWGMGDKDVWANVDKRSDINATWSGVGELLG